MRKGRGIVAALALACLPAAAGADGAQSVSCQVLDMGYISFPLARRYLVQDLATGLLAAGRKDLRDDMPLGIFFTYGRERCDRLFGSFNKLTTGFGITSANVTFSREFERSNASSANDSDQMNTGDSIQDLLLCVPIFAGAERSIAVGKTELALGLHVAAWLTKIDTTTTDAVWSAGTGTPVLVVTHDSRFLMPVSVDFEAGAFLFRMGEGTRIGITARAGYIQETRLGSDPNPDISSVGLGPTPSTNRQLIVGGVFWYVGLKIL